MEHGFGYKLGKYDNEYLLINNGLDKLEKIFNDKQRELKEKIKTNKDSYLEELVKENNEIIKNKIINCERKCEMLSNLLNYLTNNTVEVFDKHKILDEYKKIKNKLEELTELII